MDQRSTAIEMINAIKIFEESATKRRISALRGCDMMIGKGQLTTIIGPSGAGKTTLLRVIAGLESLSSGEIAIDGISLQDMSSTLRHEFRRKYIGTFTQFGRQNLDPKMTVDDAITWETLQAGWSASTARSRTTELLGSLDLEHLMHSYCGQLSAGESMRVSLIKAIAKKPLIVLADEPSGQLDTPNMMQLYNLMRQVLNEQMSILVATHDIRFQALSDQSLLILDGKLASEENSMELLSKRSRYFDQLLTEQDTVRSQVFLDSTNSIRIPDSIIRRLRLGTRLSISHTKSDEFAVLEPQDTSVATTRDEEVIADFSRSGVESEVVVEISQLSKGYGSVSVLDGINLEISRGEIVILLGPSGSGKTTLLNLIAGLERPTTGSVVVSHHDLKSSLSTRRKVRIEDISYLTQNYIAHPSFSVKENALLPVVLKDGHVTGFQHHYERLISRLELTDFENRLPGELSGGQQQRSSFMASILKQTPILLADEPTANLDTALAVKVMNIIIEEAELGTTVILATHDHTMVQPNFRVVRIEGYGIVEDIIATEDYCIDLQKQYLSH